MSSTESNVYSLKEYREFKQLQETLEKQLEEVKDLRDQLTDQMVTATRLNMIHDFD